MLIYYCAHHPLEGDFLFTVNYALGRNVYIVCLEETTHEFTPKEIDDWLKMPNMHFIGVV